jgi:sodium-dependent dicarboxylate transporter 2/3/5
LFSVTAALEETHGALRKFTTVLGWHMDALLAELPLVEPLIFLCQDFEIIYPNAPEISFGQWLIFATIKFNNVCRNFSCSLYYVSSTKDFEVLDKSFFKKI